MTNYFPQNVPVKKFCKSVSIRRTYMDKSVWLSFFLAHPVSHPSYPELLSGLLSASSYIRPSFHNQLHFSLQINLRVLSHGIYYCSAHFNLCHNYQLTRLYVVALDFSKAFDTLRHSTLLAKMAQLNLPDIVFNWLVDYFRGHEHCTR